MNGDGNGRQNGKVNGNGKLKRRKYEKELLKLQEV